MLLYNAAVLIIMHSTTSFFFSYILYIFLYISELHDCHVNFQFLVYKLHIYECEVKKGIRFFDSISWETLVILLVGNFRLLGYTGFWGVYPFEREEH